MSTGILKSMGNKRKSLIISGISFLIVTIFIVFVLEAIARKTSDRIDPIDKFIENWNPAEVVWRFGAIGSPNFSDIDLLNLRNLLSQRANRYLEDSDLKYLMRNVSDIEAWNQVFGKIPKRKLRILQKEDGVGLTGVNVKVLLIPSLAGWKIDELKSIESR